MRRWQPIETAPRDGTWVLLGWVGSPVMFSARWISEAWVDEMFDPAVNAGDPPSHWRPLPLTPEDTE